jgi:hypothetical protein
MKENAALRVIFAGFAGISIRFSGAVSRYQSE